MKIATFNADGLLSMFEPDPSGAKDANGRPLGTRITCQPSQIAAHRRDAEWEDVLPIEMKAAIDAVGRRKPALGAPG